MRSFAVVAVLLASVSAHASGPARILEGYALFASDSLRARGLHVDGGDVGVNKGRLVASSLAAPSGRLVASKIRLGRGVICSTAFGGEVRGNAASCPIASFSGSVFADPADTCGMPAIVPSCAKGERLTLKAGTTRVLGAGTYGDLRLGGSGAVLDLTGGRYVFCSLRAIRGVALRVHAPSEIVVLGELRIDGRSTLGPAPDVVLGPNDVRLLAAGPSVRVGGGAQVSARMCAPSARVALRKATWHGTAVARDIRAANTTIAAVYAEEHEPCAQRSRLRQLFFGDLHVHTALSFDAYAFDVRTTPTQAYAFAQGAPVALPPLDATGKGTQTIQIDRPLDFTAVTDHSEFLGEVELCITPGSPAYDSTDCQIYRSGGNVGTTQIAIRTAVGSPTRSPGICGPDGARCLTTGAGVWASVQEATASAYDRSAACRFTSFVGYEYTASAAVSTLHRNVIFRTDHVPYPTTVFEQPTREGLWNELRTTCSDAGIGCDVLVVPHNSNESNGKMFLPEYPGATSMDEERAMARLRGSMEPLVEVYQHKGSSECLNGLSDMVGAPDEQCDFERRYQGAFADCGDGTGSGGTVTSGCVSRRDYVRGALLEGLLEDARLGVNPFRLGMVASTDTHNGTPGAVMEDGFIGNRGMDDAEPATRLGEGQFYIGGWRFSPGGLTAVWAEENTRPAIFDALRRREVYGTSGPRLAVRVFGGWGLDAGLCRDPDMVEKGYAAGAPMGSYLAAPPASGGAPSFLVSALKDIGTSVRPGTPLQRIQMVKLWVKDGTRMQRVYDIAGDPNNGASVDEATCIPTGSGFDSLCTEWTDPDFDPSIAAVYYVRVLENPTCRWSWRECLRLPEADKPATCSNPAVPRTVQERAWTSPIWYRPPA